MQDFNNSIADAVELLQYSIFHCYKYACGWYNDIFRIKYI